MQNNPKPTPTSLKPPRPPPIPLSLPSELDPPARPDPRTHSSKPESPHQSYSPENHPPPSAPPILSTPSSRNAGAIVAIEKYYSPLTSPLPVTPPSVAIISDPPYQIDNFIPKQEAPPLSQPADGGGVGKRKEKVRFDYGGLGSKKGDVIKKVALGIRVFEVAFCLVSFSVMATNKTQGWTGDSFSRYIEYSFSGI